MEGQIFKRPSTKTQQERAQKPMFDQHKQVADQVESSNDDVPMPSAEDQALMDAALRDIKKRNNEPLPNRNRPVESRNRQSSAADTFSFNEDPLTEGAHADETVLHKLGHDDVLEYADDDAVIQYFQEHESAFTDIIDAINEKIHSNQYSKERVEQFVRDKIDLFVARDYLRPQSGVRDGGQVMVSWDRVAAIAQESGVVIPGTLVTKTEELQEQRPAPESQVGLLAKLKKVGRYFYQP
jgi:hypothetical protein